jgi:transcriptional regulator
MTRQIDLLPGTLDLLILKAVSLGPLHGYGVLQRIERITDGALLVEQGALYPALHRLERRGWLTATWALSENKRRAKFYRLTPAGADRLGEATRNWQRIAAAMAAALKTRVVDG